MNEVELTTSRAATEQLRRRHVEMAGTLAVRVDVLLRTVARGNAAAAEAARQALVEWCETELLPHASAVQEATYPTAGAMLEGWLLVDGMLDEHTAIVSLVNEVAGTEDQVAAAAAARALRSLVDVHLAKEDDLLLPLLAASGAPVAELLSRRTVH